MTTIRLGDRIISSKKPLDKVQTAAAIENLASQIFYSVERTENNFDYYVPRIVAKQDILLDINIPNIGEYEKSLIGKILNPITPLMCLVGQMGSGKSTTIKLLLLALNKIHQKRLFSVIDFRRTTNLGELSGNTLTSQLLQTINIEIQARLRASAAISLKEELTKFWEKEINLYNQGIGTPSRSFQVLIANSEDFSLLEIGSSNDENIDKKRELLQIVKQNPELYFDYLLRLWKYASDNYFNRTPGIIILDNLDSVPAEVQRNTLSLMLKFAEKGGPIFILAVRPETFDRMGLNDQIFDVIYHDGPHPFDVVANRIQRFLQSPSKYVSETWLSTNEYLLIKNYLEKIIELLNSENGGRLLRDFLRNVCGKSIRSALRLSESLFRSNSISDKQVTVHDIIRLMIREGEQQYRWNGNNIIQNLFRVTGNGQSSTLLIKLRILKLLANDPSKKKNLNEIQNIATSFYDSNIIIKALNEMLSINSQMILSNTFDFFSKDIAHESSELITLSEVGEGYLELSNKIDYFQEMMLDSFVNSDKFPTEVQFDYLVDKLQLIIFFLKELLKTDVEEVNSMLRRFSIEFYFDAFGTRLITVDIVQSISEEINRIIRSTSQKFGERSDIVDSMKDIDDRLMDIRLLAQARSEQLLGIRFSVSKDE